MTADLLLINPCSQNQNPMMPLGLAALAAYVRDAGHSVQALDAWAETLQSEEQVKQRLRNIPPPRVAGVSVLTPNLRGAKMIVLALREIFPDTLILIGGPHVSALPDTALDEFPEADMGVFGEGELTLSEIMSRVKSGGALSGIEGTLWRDNGITLKGNPRGVIKDLDILPRPARDLFPIDLYHSHLPYGRRWRYMNEITSRGCPFKCAYCSKSVYGNSYRAFSPARVIEDLRELTVRYQVREIHFYDDDLTLNRKRTVELLERLIEAKLDLIWSCTTRCDLVDYELLLLMKKAGCWMVSYGVESGNDILRETINKGVDRSQIETAVRDTKRAGLRVTGYLMIGLPGETEETVRETIEFADALDPDYVNWAVMTVYPGSPFYFDLKAGKYGLGRLVEDEAGGGDSPFQDSFLIGFEGALTRQRMYELARQATRHFYLRPGKMLRILRDIRSAGQIKQLAKTGWQTLSWLLSPPADQRG
jgi:radical SAM superfamily enzyme YgiQ (UPF0313 family)